MEQYAGIDVSLDSASVCIVDAQGKILKEAKVACEPEALIAWFAAHGTPMARIGLEAGPLSQWLFAKMKAAGLPVSGSVVRVSTSGHIRETRSNPPRRGTTLLSADGGLSPAPCIGRDDHGAVCWH